MKSFIKIILLILTTFSVSLSSCTKEEYTPDNEQLNFKEVTSITSTIVGSAHNASLANTYTALEQLSASATSSNINCAIVNSRLFLIEQYNIQPNFIDSIYNALQVGTTTLNIDLLINTIDDQEYKSLILRILDIKNDGICSYEIFDEKLSKIEDDASKTNYSNEIGAVCSVARNSYIYWHENLNDWRLLLANSTKSAYADVDPRFWDILFEDAKGAVGGAFFGGIVGSLVGAPVMSAIEGIKIAIQAK